MYYKDKYFRFNYQMHIPNQVVKSGVGYMKRISFDSNFAKSWAQSKENYVGEVTLIDYIEIDQEEYDLHMTP